MPSSMHHPSCLPSGDTPYVRTPSVFPVESVPGPLPYGLFALDPHIHIYSMAMAFFLSRLFLILHCGGFFISFLLFSRLFCLLLIPPQGNLHLPLLRSVCASSWGKFGCNRVLLLLVLLLLLFLDYQVCSCWHTCETRPVRVDGTPVKEEIREKVEADCDGGGQRKIPPSCKP